MSKNSVFLSPIGQLHPGRANKRKTILNFSFSLEGNAAKRQRVHEVKNENVAPIPFYAGPTLPDLAILCRIATWGRSLRYVLPSPSHRHSVAGNDRIMMSLSSFQSKIFKGGCKKGMLMQYKCMEKKIRKLHGRILFPSVMYIANIPAGMQL